MCLAGHDGDGRGPAERHQRDRGRMRRCLHVFDVPRVRRGKLFNRLPPAQDTEEAVLEISAEAPAHQPAELQIDYDDWTG